MRPTTSHIRDAGRVARAFSLIELIIVIVVIGILAATVVPRFVGATQEASLAATRENLMQVQLQVDRHNSPPAIDAGWFRAGQIPPHPDAPDGVAMVQTVNTSGVAHPGDKVLTGSVAGCYWYNSATGAVRARVPDQGSASATLDYYNEVNASNESALGNYGGGGGGGS